MKMLLLVSTKPASIIDGVRLSKAKHYRYQHIDMAALEEQLKQAHIDQCQVKMIVTDGVFSMDGTVANLEKICELATEYQALVMIDDCHATGFIGKNGKGSADTNTLNKVDIISNTLGKALGGASGGFIAARKPIIDLLRQKSRPYLFSNSIAPMIAQLLLPLLIS